MIISHDALSVIHRVHQNKKIVFCSGSFDLTHVGHILFFEYCKKQGDVLVVMVGDDESIRQSKGPERPILNERARLKTVASLKPVDYALLNWLPESKFEPFHLFELVFEKLKPKVYVVNSDARNIPARKKITDKYNVELIMFRRETHTGFEEISTTNIINKIVHL